MTAGRLVKEIGHGCSRANLASSVGINTYRRNKTKLQGLLPELIDHKSVSVFEGSVLDVNLVATCLYGCKAVFMVVTSHDNIPGCHLGQDQARSVIAALGKLKSSSTPGSMRIPKLILLSSATIDYHLARDMPWWFRPIMLTAASHVY